VVLAALVFLYELAKKIIGVETIAEGIEDAENAAQTI
jgi:hypothetical protein